MRARAILIAVLGMSFSGCVEASDFAAILVDRPLRQSNVALSKKIGATIALLADRIYFEALGSTVRSQIASSGTGRTGRDRGCCVEAPRQGACVRGGWPS